MRRWNITTVRLTGLQDDAALGLIETREGKERVRKAVREILTVPEKPDLATHVALLRLATSKSGAIKLVTTNFDEAFHRAMPAEAFNIDYAPHLPLPGASWNSIVHLHGGLR